MIRNVESLKEQLRVMFDEEDYVFHYSKKEINNFFKRDEFHPAVGSLLCLNAIDGKKDRNPWRDFHHVNKPRRCDDNVVKYRNFLIECDGVVGIDNQLAIMEKYRIPYSLAVWSGNKSVHFIISLEEPISERSWGTLINALLPSNSDCEYFKKTKQWLGIEEADKACKNPSRGCRAAGIERDNGNEQTLLKNNGRVSLSSILKVIEIQKQPPRPRYTIEHSDDYWVKKYQEKLQELSNTQKGGRHIVMVATVYFASKIGIPQDKCLADITNCCDLPYSEVQNTINCTVWGK
jgi:hypothetical protein